MGDISHVLLDIFTGGFHTNVNYKIILRVADRTKKPDQSPLGKYINHNNFFVPPV